MLFLHGAPSTPRCFDRIVARLAGARRSLVATLPGYGGAARLVPYRWDRACELIEEALARAGVERCAVVGYSAGSARAFWLALSGRVEVERLVALAPILGLDDAQRAAYRGLAAQLRDPTASAALLEAWPPTLMGDALRASDSPDARDVLGWGRATSPEALADELEAFASAPDRRPELARLTIPVLLRVGADDATTPPVIARDLAARLPRAVLEVVPACRHALPYEDPANTKAVVDFLLA